MYWCMYLMLPLLLDGPMCKIMTILAGFNVCDERMHVALSSMDRTGNRNQGEPFLRNAFLRNPYVIGFFMWSCQFLRNAFRRRRTNAQNASKSVPEERAHIMCSICSNAASGFE